MERADTVTGPDERGTDLDILIRIGPDGRVYLHDITVDLLPIVLSLDPGNAGIRRRMEAAAEFDVEVPE